VDAFLAEGYTEPVVRRGGQETSGVASALLARLGQKAMAFEEVCERCGRCCAAKVIIHGEVHYTPFSCRHQDSRTRACTVYDRRHEVNSDCLSLEEGILLGVFPADCPYVRDIPDYEAPRVEHTSMDSFFDLLKLAGVDPEPKGRDPR